MGGVASRAGPGQRDMMRPLPALKADCSACAALCCMALPFDRGEDFARDKPALHPCPNLSGHACAIHDRLLPAGYRGCTLFDCLGAGQRVVQEVFAGADWQQDATLRAPMAEALGILRRIHTGLELLAAAESLALPPVLAAEREALVTVFHPEIAWTADRLRRFAASGAEARLRAFLAALRPHVGAP
jgi:hypothetical protein